MPIIEICKNCGRQRPDVVSDPSCREFGVATKRENVKQAFEYLVVALNPSATREEKFAADVAIDMLLDALEIGL